MFPTRFPFCTWLAVLASLAFAVASFFTWRHFAPPLQVFYLSKAGHYVYLTSALPRPMGQKLQDYSLFADGCCSIGNPKTPLWRLVYVTSKATPRGYHNMIALRVYEGGLPHVMRWYIRADIAFAVIAFVLGANADTARRKRFREGVRQRGPMFKSPQQYNRQTKGDGIEIRLA
jgi:hypothetical protein